MMSPLVARTALPAFVTCSVDGWAVRGSGPWRVVGRVLAGDRPRPLTEDGTCVQIATGAMVPEGAAQTVRIEDSTRDGDLVNGASRSEPEWRNPGDEAARGEEMIPAGVPVTPGVVGLAASCGYDTPGVEISEREPRRRFEGDARRHHMTGSPRLVLR